ncbi:Ribonuclease P protein component 2 [uncultured archaeon]|nr:Ribonuclease P protein component 2 [uncultured archaeon]
MKSLKPSLREKKRYLLIEGAELKKNVEKAISEFIGALGMSKTGLEWIKSEKNSAIISINRNIVDAVRASLVIFPQKIEVKMVSGTLKSLKEKI